MFKGKKPTIFLLCFSIIFCYQVLFSQDITTTNVYITSAVEDYLNASKSIKSVLISFHEQGGVVISVTKGKQPLKISIFDEEVRQIIIKEIGVYFQEQKKELSECVKSQKAYADSLKQRKTVKPPINSNVNNFLQFLGSERVEFAIKNKFGMMFGIGTPYSGPRETDFVEFNITYKYLKFNPLNFGLYAGLFNKLDALQELFSNDRHNNIYATLGFQAGLLININKFDFSIGLQNVIDDLSISQISTINSYGVKEFNYTPKILEGTYVNVNLGYNFELLSAKRNSVYLAYFQDEIHLGLSGREYSLINSLFDFRIDFMPYSKDRNEQLLTEFMVQKIGNLIYFKNVALGFTTTFSYRNDGTYGLLDIFLNARVKLPEDLFMLN